MKHKSRERLLYRSSTLLWRFEYLNSGLRPSLPVGYFCISLFSVIRRVIRSASSAELAAKGGSLLFRYSRLVRRILQE